VADFFVVKRQRLDIVALYNPHGRYRFYKGINWRALLAFVFALGPAMPGLAYNVNPEVDIGRAIYISYMNWYYGITVAFVSYSLLSLIWPAKGLLVPHMIEGIESGLDAPEEGKQDSVVVSSSEKH
jgi:NCS1 family nucleobase:cation symporter-1